MPGLLLQLDGFVLEKKLAAEPYQQLTLFTRENGLLICLQRVSGRSLAGLPPLDFFDEAHFSLESSNQGRTWFLKEARLLTRHSSIGANYASLLRATAFARLIVRNRVHEESRPQLYNLLSQAFAAWSVSARPEVVFFKSLFSFARDEGYPVKEEWWVGLEPEARRSAASLLNLPATEQTCDSATAESLIGRLEHYLRTRTEILFD